MRFQYPGTRALLVLVAMLVAGCGTLPPAAPYDATIDQTTAQFDKAFQAKYIEMTRTAGTTAGEYAQYGSFYDEWNAQLAHLVNVAIATDPSNECPLSNDVGKGIQALTRFSGTAAGDAVDASGNVLDILSGGLQAIEARIGEIEKDLAQPAGTLEPAQIEDAKAELARLQKTKASLSEVASAATDYQVEAPKGGCATIVVALLQKQFKQFQAVHQAQGKIGMPARAKAPYLLMNVVIQNVLKMEAVKKAKS